MHGLAGPTILEEMRHAMTAAGFEDVEGNAMGFAGLGYVRARRVDAAPALRDSGTG
jgi:hypothetical protein